MAAIIKKNISQMEKNETPQDTKGWSTRHKAKVWPLPEPKKEEERDELHDLDMVMNIIFADYDPDEEEPETPAL